MKGRENLVFFNMLLIIFACGIITFIKPEKTISNSENRSLITFDHFTINSFLDGSFQDNFENAISDQFIFSEKIRTAYMKLMNSAPTIISKDEICKNHYLELTSSIDRRRGTFNCDDYIIYYPEPLTEEQADTVASNIKKFNHVNSLTKTYYYFVNDSSVFDFEKNEKVIDYESLLKANLSGKYHLSSLSFNNYDEYKQYFYKTDHHWDYRGSYKGYQDIINLLGLSSPLKPTGTGTNHEYFFGSHAQNTKYYDIKEEFSFYYFSIPNYNTIINGSPATYGNRNDYINHNYEYDPTTNYYAYFYGIDEGEIIYDFHAPEKDNLLMIVNSYSNAVNELIASHFNKTYVIDLRHYKLVFGDFSITDYLKNHKIDKTLFIISPTFIRENDTTKGLES